MRLSSVFLLLCVQLARAAILPAGTASPAATASSVPVALSADRQYVLVTSAGGNGLRLLDTTTRHTQRITDQPHTAPFASISPDERYVCYKAFVPAASGLAQVPTLFDVRRGTSVALCSPAPLAGTPVASRDGRIAFTVGRDLVVLASDLTHRTSVTLRERANLLSFSPDGRQIAVAFDRGGIAVGGAEDLAFREIVPGHVAAAPPQWSPDGERLAYRTADAQVVTVELATGAWTGHGEGEEPGWLDATTVGFARCTVVDGEVASTEVVASGAARKAPAPIYSEPREFAAVVSAGGVAIGGDGAVSVGFYANHAVHAEGTVVDSGAEATPAAALDAADGDLVRLKGVPYLHQKYDVPAGFDGNSACGATAAIMAMQFTGVLPAHRITCASPAKHTSDFGWYVSETYTFNGHTFDVGSPDPHKHVGHGGFGYITQNHWENTRAHMAEYISAHGKTSSVDFAPSYAVAQAEVDQAHPFVVLTSLTHSGHYICCIGYSKTHQTLVFNDPWGDKNQGYPNPRGAGACYDWPGQNNGHANLNTVHCFIYCR